MATPDSVLTNQSIFFVNDDKVPSLTTGEYEFFKKDILDKTQHLHLLKMPIFNSMFYEANNADYFVNVSTDQTSRAKIIFKDTQTNKHPNFTTSKIHPELFLGMYKKKVTDENFIEIANRNFCYKNKDIKKTRLIVDISKNRMYFSDGVDLHIDLELKHFEPNLESLWSASNKKIKILNHMGDKIDFPGIHLLIRRLKNGSFDINIFWYTTTHDLMVNDKPTINWSKNSIRTTGTSGNIEYSYFKGIDDVTNDPYKTGITAINYQKYNMERLVPAVTTNLVLPPSGGDHHPNDNWSGECEYRKLENTACDFAQICASINLTKILYKIQYPEPSRYDKKQDQNILEVRSQLGMKAFADKELEERLSAAEEHNRLDKITAEELDTAEKNISTLQNTIKGIDQNRVSIIDLTNRITVIENKKILQDIKPPKPEDTVEYKINKLNESIDKLNKKLDSIVNDISQNRKEITENNPLIIQHGEDIFQIKNDIDMLFKNKQDKSQSRINTRSLEDKIDLLLDKLN